MDLGAMDVRTAGRRALLCAAALLGLGLMAGVAQARPTAREAAGARIARAYCGECHATGRGLSPLADAPPFRELHKRYPPGGGLNDLLAKGMITSDTPSEEGGAARHPRMPQVHLDEAQIGELTAYIRSIQTRR